MHVIFRAGEGARVVGLILFLIMFHRGPFVQKEKPRRIGGALKRFFRFGKYPNGSTEGVL